MNWGLRRKSARSDSNASDTANAPESVACSLDYLLQLRNSAAQLKPQLGRRPLRRKSTTNSAGNHRSPFRGRGMDFEEVRLYQPGDDIRHIDWRVTARTGHAHTKLFKEEQERPVFFIVDQSRSMFFGSVRQFKSVLASHLAATLAWKAFHAKDRVGGIIFNDHQLIDLKPTSGKRGTLRFLHSLSEMNRHLLNRDEERPLTGMTDTEEPNSLLNSLSHLRSICKPGSLIYLISDYRELRSQGDKFCDKTQSHLRNLTQHNEVQCLFVFDPAEEQLPDWGVVGISNGRDRRQIDTHQNALRRRHADNFSRSTEQMVSSLLALGAPTSRYSTADPAETQLALGGC